MEKKTKELETIEEYILKAESKSRGLKEYSLHPIFMKICDFRQTNLPNN